MAFKFLNRSDFGKLMLIVGLLISVPLLIIPFYPQDKAYALSFIFPSLCSVAAGVAGCLIGGKDDLKIEWRTSMQRASLTVLFAWGWGILMGALPFVIK
jgi:trk system potassium uptake protein TrkH